MFMIMVDIFAHYLRFTHGDVVKFASITEVWISDEYFWLWHALMPKLIKYAQKVFFLLEVLYFLAQIPLKGCISSKMSYFC